MLSSHLVTEICLRRALSLATSWRKVMLGRVLLAFLIELGFNVLIGFD